MKYKVLLKVFTTLYILLSAVSAPSLCAYARNLHMPRLIQTVSEQDIYEGLIALKMLECPVLEESDCEDAYENVKNCVVGVWMGNAHGSGILWEMTPDEVVIATNGHVLEYWKDADSYVYFPQGYYTDARIIGVSAYCDVGFIVVERSQFTYEELQTLRSARVDLAVYEGLRGGEEMFFVDPGTGAGEGQCYEAVMVDAHRYIEDFGTYMLYGHGFAKAGMSGGGAFDGRGYLIGMTTGGTLRNETASVPLPDIMEAYEEVMQK